MFRNVLLILFVFVASCSYSQTCVEKQPYDKEYHVESTCSGCKCKRAYWFHSTGEKIVHVWTGRAWVDMKKNGYYWFRWDEYSRCGSHKEE